MDKKQIIAIAAATGVGTLATGWIAAVCGLAFFGVYKAGIEIGKAQGKMR